VSSVNDLLNRLKDSIAAQKRFLADAAHQLKTPLAGLRMQADLAQREGSNTEELKRSLQQIGRASIRATHTVNQLLALARAEGSGAPMTRQPCDLARLTIDMVQDSFMRALEKHIDLGYDGTQPDSQGVQIEGNPTLLKELIRNLLDNAINYTPSSTLSPGVVTARVQAEPESGTVLLQVEDSGAGIALAERELVFQPFYRTLGTDADGTGLGLAIVHEIAQRHGASITLADTHPGRAAPGARFTVQFAAIRQPVSMAPGTAARPGPATPAPGHRP
jgi:two-component system sensor histidine kinase TctE